MNLGSFSPHVTSTHFVSPSTSLFSDSLPLRYHLVVSSYIHSSPLCFPLPFLLVLLRCTPRRRFRLPTQDDARREDNVVVEKEAPDSNAPDAVVAVGA